jgi:hypothetical protein
MFRSANGQVSHAVGTDREWFHSMFPAWDCKVQSLLFSAISPFLEYLTLGNNSFHGHIPYQLGNLFRLNKLYLYLNELQGSIPPTLGRCRSLSSISFPYNNLSGSIPSELCVLPNLEFIYLELTI